MKTLILTVTSIFILNTTYAQQNDLAFLNSNASVLYKASNIKNNSSTVHASHYFKTVAKTNTSNVVNKFEKEILNYNIKTKEIYNNSEAALYQVKFKQKNAKALVHYNNTGQILSSNEVYHSVRVPYKIRISIAKSFPGWSLEKSTLKINYNNINRITKTYLIVIKKEGLNKQIKIDGTTFKMVI